MSLHGDDVIPHYIASDGTDQYSCSVLVTVGLKAWCVPGHQHVTSHQKETELIGGSRNSEIHLNLIMSFLQSDTSHNAIDNTVS